MLTPNKFVLSFRGCCLTSVPLLAKMDQEMRPWECGQTDRHTHCGRDRLVIYNLSHAICYSYGAGNKRPNKTRLKYNGPIFSL